MDYVKSAKNKDVDCLKSDNNKDADCVKSVKKKDADCGKKPSGGQRVQGPYNTEHASASALHKSLMHAII